MRQQGTSSSFTWPPVMIQLLFQWNLTKWVWPKHRGVCGDSSEGLSSGLLPSLEQEGMEWAPWQLVHSLSCLALALVPLHTPARCRVNDCFNGKELESTHGLEPGCIKEKLMTDIYMEMSINIFYMLLTGPLVNVFLMETNWIISQPSAFVSPELCLKITLF